MSDASYNAWIEWTAVVTDAKGGGQRTYGPPMPVIMIETDLQLAPNMAGFDSSALDDLILEVVNLPVFNRLSSPTVRVVPRPEDRTLGV